MKYITLYKFDEPMKGIPQELSVNFKTRTINVSGICKPF